MRNALALFNSNITSAREAGGLYDYLIESVPSPMCYDDLLRSQIVYSVSAFDKLIHDLVRIGMVETYLGMRNATSKYLNEPISLKMHTDLSGASIPPKEFIFEQAISQKLKIFSYQDPDKVADGLSYIWDEIHKWQEIAKKIGMNYNSVRTQLKLIGNRRNSIVHEGDIDPVTNIKLHIDRVDCKDNTDFLHCCGNAIANLVKL